MMKERSLMLDEAHELVMQIELDGLNVYGRWNIYKDANANIRPHVSPSFYCIAGEEHEMNGMTDAEIYDELEGMARV